MSKTQTGDTRDEAHFRVLRLLSERPQASQREIADALGISLGKVNYLLKALVAKGHVKVENFRASPHKLGYWHVLTPGGVSERAVLARRFLQRKLAEYEALEAEIAQLRSEAVGSAAASTTGSAVGAQVPR